MLLRFPEPYDFEVSTERFRAFGPDLANLWREGGLHRVVAGQEVRIEAAPKAGSGAGKAGTAQPEGGGGVEVDPLDAEIETEVQTLLGGPFDLRAFTAWARTADEVVRRLAGRIAGFRPPLAPDPFEALVGAIAAQQVSLFAAFAIRNRLIERFGKRAEYAYAFPTRERLARAREEQVVAVGFSRRKAEYVVALARSDLDLAALADLPDEEVKERITAQRGLGEWTADWFLARHLARPRAWPAGDLGLRKAVAAFYGDVDVRAIGQRFDPFQNLVAHYLLTGLRVVGT